MQVGELREVTERDINNDPFMGKTVFGDSYSLGTKRVRKRVREKSRKNSDYIIYSVHCGGVGACAHTSKSNNFEAGKKIMLCKNYTDIRMEKSPCCIKRYYRGKEVHFTVGFSAVDANGKKTKGCFGNDGGENVIIRFKH